MSNKTKYQLLILLVAAMLLYLTATEVAERWGGMIEYYGRLTQQEASFSNPQELSEKKTILQAQRKMLLAKLTSRSGKFEQSRTGVFEYLNHCARGEGIKYGSLVPLEVKNQGDTREEGFKVSFAAGYHQTGRWMNKTECGAIPVQFRKIELSTDNARSGKLKVSAEGKAFTFQSK